MFALVPGNLSRNRVFVEKHRFCRAPVENLALGVHCDPEHDACRVALSLKECEQCKRSLCGGGVTANRDSRCEVVARRLEGELAECVYAERSGERVQPVDKLDLGNRKPSGYRSPKGCTFVAWRDARALQVPRHVDPPGVRYGTWTKTATERLKHETLECSVVLDHRVGGHRIGVGKGRVALRSSNQERSNLVGELLLSRLKQTHQRLTLRLAILPRFDPAKHLLETAAFENAENIGSGYAVIVHRCDSLNQPVKHSVFRRVRIEKVSDDRWTSLAVPIHPAVSLLETIRIPRKLEVIDTAALVLQIQALARRVSRKQHATIGLMKLRDTDLALPRRKSTGQFRKGLAQHRMHRKSVA